MQSSKPDYKSTFNVVRKMWFRLALKGYNYHFEEVYEVNEFKIRH